jgi:hypothetical protein
MTADRPRITVHLYPAGVPNVIEAPFGVDPLALMDLAERIDQEPATLVVSGEYEIAFCVHRPVPEPMPIAHNGDGRHG